MANQIIRVGIIGAGSNTRKMHIPGFRKIDGVELTIVCNRSRESSKKVADEFGIPAIADHWSEVVHSSEVDAVMIGAWPNMHADPAIAALDAGKHVLTEARMARDLSEAVRMLETSRRHPGLVAQVVPAPMSLDVDSTIIKTIESGAIGDLREVCVTHTGGQYLQPDVPMTWRQDAGLSGLNILTMGIYHEMVQRWLCIEPEWVFADGEVFTEWRMRVPDGDRARVAVPDSISIVGRFPGNTRLVYHFSGVEAGQPRNEIRLNGARGGLRFDVESNQLHQSDGAREWAIGIPSEKRRGWRVEEDFIASIRTGAPVRLTSFEEGVKYMRFTDAVHCSMRSGAKENLARI